MSYNSSSTEDTPPIIAQAQWRFYVGARGHSPPPPKKNLAQAPQIFGHSSSATGWINCFYSKFRLAVVASQMMRGQAPQIFFLEPPLLKQGVFGVGEFNCVIEMCLRPTPVAMVTKIWKFLQTICCNWASMGDMLLTLAPMMGFSGSANLTV